MFAGRSRKSMKATASFLCRVSRATDRVCGLTPCAVPSAPAGGGSTVHAKPSGACWMIC